MRREAKRLLADIRHGDAHAIARYASVWSVPDPQSHATLQRVQHVIARDVGRSSWTDQGFPDFILSTSRTSWFTQQPRTLVVGASGSGKTASIGALAAHACLAGRDVHWIAVPEPDAIPTWAGAVLASCGRPTGRWTVSTFHIGSDMTERANLARMQLDSVVASCGACHQRPIVIMDEAWIVGSTYTWAAWLDRCAPVCDVILMTQSMDDAPWMGLVPALEDRPWIIAACASSIVSDDRRCAMVKLIDTGVRTDIVVGLVLTELGVATFGSSPSERALVRQACARRPAASAWDIVSTIAAHT
jgi:hypothetical protein